MPNARPVPQRRTLAAFLAGLPSLELSESGRRNVAARFGLTDEQLAAALAIAQQRKGSRP
jgi:predicted branched-subunit amino acid permease